jgi:hypothetical protein
MTTHGGGTSPRVRDLAVQWRTFAGIGAAVVVFAVVYWFASYDYAGTVMLTLASGLSFFTAAYLWWQDRAIETSGRHAADEQDAVVDEAPYLPHASIWPFGIGVGAFLAFNGLVVGPGYAVPGAIVIGGSIAGLVMQSRRRE